MTKIFADAVIHFCLFLIRFIDSETLYFELWFTTKFNPSNSDWYDWYIQVSAEGFKLFRFNYATLKHTCVLESLYLDTIVNHLKIRLRETGQVIENLELARNHSDCPIFYFENKYLLPRPNYKIETFRKMNINPRRQDLISSLPTEEEIDEIYKVLQILNIK